MICFYFTLCLCTCTVASSSSSNKDTGDSEATTSYFFEDGTEKSPQLDKRQKVIETSFGNLLVFGCKLLEGSPDTKIRWKYRSAKSKHFANIKPPVVKDPFVANKFIIKSVARKDLGFYKCIAENNEGRDEHTYEVVVKAAATKAPQIDKTSKAINATKGYPFTLTCNIVGGDPAKTISWLYKEKGSKMFKTTNVNGESYIINSVDNEHAGSYKCVARNEAGKDSHLISLTVQDLKQQAKKTLKGKKKPKQSESSDSSVSDSSESWGVASREKRPRIHKNKESDGDSIYDYPESYDSNAEYKDYYPFRQSLGVLKSDSGKNDKEAKHKKGKPIQSLAEKPSKIVEKKTKITAVVGSPTALKCGAIAGFTKISHFHWRFKRHSKDKLYQWLKFNEKTYVIQSAQPKDSGFYQCHVHYDRGLYNETFELVVTGAKDNKGKLIQSLAESKENKVPATEPPKIIKEKTKITAVVGFPTSLYCGKIAGLSKILHFHWLFKGSSMDRWHWLNFNESTYMIPSVQREDEGFYRCDIQYDGGLHNLTYELVVTDFMNEEMRLHYGRDGEIKDDLMVEYRDECIFARNPQNKNT